MNIMYHALFVDDQGRLKALFPPVHDNLFYHHCTIEFSPKDTSNFEMGRKVNLEIVGRITTDRVDALLVVCPKSKNKFPHITLSTAPGVKPFESNKAFEDHPELIQRINVPTSIATTEGYYSNTVVLK